MAEETDDQLDERMTRSLQRSMRRHSILGSDGTNRITILLLLDMLGSVLEGLATKKDLLELKQLIMTNAEVIRTLNETTGVIKKVVLEIKGSQTAMNKLHEKIAELEAIIANGNASEEVATAVAAVRSAADVADAELPDLPVIPPPVEAIIHPNTGAPADRAAPFVNPPPAGHNPGENEHGQTMHHTGVPVDSPKTDPARTDTDATHRSTGEGKTVKPHTGRHDR